MQQYRGSKEIVQNPILSFVGDLVFENQPYETRAFNKINNFNIFRFLYGQPSMTKLRPIKYFQRNLFRQFYKTNGPIHVWFTRGILIGAEP